MNNNQTVLICGDIHGDWQAFMTKLKYQKISDCLMIGVGDLGIGFLHPEKQERQFEWLNDHFKSHNIEFVGIRGNHDHKKYFDENVKYSNFELLPDYTYRTINGEKFLFVGGAVSVDRCIRVPERNYWYDEGFVLDVEKIEECDVLITHSAPSWIGPADKSTISGWCAKDPTLWDECMHERRQHDELIKLAKPKRHYIGHFHTFEQVEHNGCLSRIVDIMELVEHRNEKV
jgi:UDP-2,3-diacylglucosamine pyrophosphatase LpxH